MPKTIEFEDEHHLRVGKWDFHCAFPLGDRPAGRFPVLKQRAYIDRYIALCATEQPKTIVELGIFGGGSTVLLSELAEPVKLVAVELASEPAAMLADYITRAGVADRVRPFYGVDQADRERLASIVAAEFGGRPIDLVIDDASHLLAETRSSFETLFPYVRPGGLFVIEDWNCGHQLRGHVTAALERGDSRALAIFEESFDKLKDAPPERPLSSLVVELMLALACGSDALTDVALNSSWTEVRRGPGPLDPVGFRLADLYRDHFGQLGATAVTEV